MEFVYYFIIETHLNRAYCDVGWGNGYVLLPKGHPWYGKFYTDIDVYVHGGLTYSDLFPYNWFAGDRHFEMCEQLNINKLKDFWCIGFDCSHYDDDLTTCPQSYVWEQAKSLHEQCISENIPELKIWLRKCKLEKLNAIQKIA